MLRKAFALRRIAGCFTLIYVCWDIKPVFYALWSPFTFLMGYNDPRKPTDDLLHGVLPSSVHAAEMQQQAQHFQAAAHLRCLQAGRQSMQDLACIYIHDLARGLVPLTPAQRRIG